MNELFDPNLPMAELIIEAFVIGIIFSVGFFFIGHIADIIVKFLNKDE